MAKPSFIFYIINQRISKENGLRFCLVCVRVCLALLFRLCQKKNGRAFQRKSPASQLTKSSHAFLTAAFIYPHWFFEILIFNTRWNTEILCRKYAKNIFLLFAKIRKNEKLILHKVNENKRHACTKTHENWATQTMNATKPSGLGLVFI